MERRSALWGRVRDRWQEMPRLERFLNVSVISLALGMVVLSLWRIAAESAPSWVGEAAEWLGWLAVGGIVVLVVTTRRSSS